MTSIRLVTGGIMTEENQALQPTLDQTSGQTSSTRADGGSTRLGDGNGTGTGGGGG